MSQIEKLKLTAQKLKETRLTKSALVGFDGFVDEIIHLVDERKDINEFERIKTMTAFADRIKQAAGKSCNIEMVINQAKLGDIQPPEH